MLKDISADVLKIDMGFLRASENEAKGDVYKRQNLYKRGILI